MSGPQQLIIDADAMTATGSALAAVSQAFNTANTDAHTLAGHIGPCQPKLTKAVTDFATAWDDRRKQLQKAIEAISDGATAIGKGFQTADQQLADGLEQGTEAPVG